MNYLRYSLYYPSDSAVSYWIVPLCPWVFCGDQRLAAGLAGKLWGRDGPPSTSNDERQAGFHAAETGIDFALLKPVLPMGLPLLQLSRAQRGIIRSDAQRVDADRRIMRKLTRPPFVLAEAS